MSAHLDPKEGDDCQASEKLAVAALDAMLACEEALADGARLCRCRTCQNIEHLHSLLTVGCLNFIGKLQYATAEIEKRLHLWDDFNDVAIKRDCEAARTPLELPDETENAAGNEVNRTPIPLETSPHEVHAYRALKRTGGKWVTAEEFATLANIAGRTARDKLAKFVALGVAERFDAHGGYRYRFTGDSPAADRSYVAQLETAVKVLG